MERLLGYKWSASEVAIIEKWSIAHRRAQWIGDQSGTSTTTSSPSTFTGNVFSGSILRYSLPTGGSKTFPFVTSNLAKWLLHQRYLSFNFPSKRGFAWC